MKVKKLRDRFVRILPIMAFVIVLFSTREVNAMHVMEGFLPVTWAIVWSVLALPFVILGIRQMKKHATDSRLTMLLVLAGAYIFVLSAMKIPSVTGSCSHPTGTGLSAILFGPLVTSVLGLIVLLFQALLLAHGGLTTLGANTFSMAIVGPIVAFAVYKLIVNKKVTYKENKGRMLFGVFLAAALADLITYVVTAFQLALAHPGAGFGSSFAKFLSIFAVTQIPLAVVEGILTTIIFSVIAERNQNELRQLAVVA